MDCTIFGNRDFLKGLRYVFIAFMIFTEENNNLIKVKDLKKRSLELYETRNILENIENIKNIQAILKIQKYVHKR